MICCFSLHLFATRSFGIKIQNWIKPVSIFLEVDKSYAGPILESKRMGAIF